VELGTRQKNKGEIEMEKAQTQRIISLVLKAVAVGMSVSSIVMGFIPGAADADTHITLLGIGLAALAVAALRQEN
jgi:hypothetical protein